MAVATGLAAGGNYFNQPLLDTIAASLGTTQAAAAATVTIAQVAYAIGLLFLVPLGDMLERRNLAVGLMLAAAGGQAISGFATSITTLSIGIAVAGLFSVTAQVLVPLAATLAVPERSGRAVGTVMSGLLLGILLGRSFAGLLAGIGGWWTAYRLGAVLMVVIALALWRALPTSRPTSPQGYLATLRSTAELAFHLPRLRTRALLGALSFASLSALFSTMAFLLAAPPFSLSDVAIGAMGLAGVAGALAANAAGGLADRGKSQLATGVALATLVISWPIFALGGTSLVWFAVGMVLADLGLQGIHVSNQNIIYALAPHARARLTSVYMTTYFAGAALGSALGTAAWATAGWSGVVWLGGALSLATAAAWLLDLRVERALSAAWR
jgi:predicted MFS family arabinose efflux permease